MAKTWVLDTETKGTGATMVPLEKARRQPGAREPFPVRRKPQPPAEPAHGPRAPRRFKVVDAMTRQTLAEDVGVRDAVAALKDVRSVVDVSLYVWEPDREDWRMLTVRERQAVWKLSDR
jgi:hypothetical protein